MKTSPTTSSSEARFRTALLDVLHAQWRAFGVPFNSPLADAELEVIDPEALVWCTLGFLDEEPRLAESTRAWLAANHTRLVRQRLNSFAREWREDTRSALWRKVDAHGAGSLGKKGNRFAGKDRGRPAKALGRQADDPSTLFLRARDVLGKDCRSFLIVFLIGSPRGVRLREVTNWTGYSYRTISEAATGWERGGVVRIEHGHCVLGNPAPWRELLDCIGAKVVTVDWSSVYRASIELLRTLAKAREHGFGDEHPLVASAIDATDRSLVTAAAGADAAGTPALERLREALATSRSHQPRVRRTLTGRDSNRFLNIIDSEAEPNAALRAAAKGHRARRA